MGAGLRRIWSDGGCQLIESVTRAPGTLGIYGTFLFALDQSELDILILWK